MIDLYTLTTPNGQKPAILLEELEMAYTIHRVDITKGEQFRREFLAFSPNGKIPAILDRDTGLSVFESGAILMHLAEKAGSSLLPSQGRERIAVIEWLMFQMASVGPMFGQLGHFRHYAPEKIAYAIGRYEKEALRLLGVLERQLERHPYVAGAYSIADIALYPWVVLVEKPYGGVSFEPFPQLRRWIGLLQERPAVTTGMAVLRHGFHSAHGVLAPAGAEA